MEGQKTGIGEYAYNLLNELFEIDRQNEYYLFYNSHKDIEQNIPKYNYINVHYCKFTHPNKLLNLSLKFFKYPKIDQLIYKQQKVKIDLFILPNINFYAFSKGVKTILTIHDLSFKRFPEFFSLKRRLWHWIINPKKLCQKANQIIAVSRSTKRDLADLYKIDEEKIQVIHSGISPIIKKQEKLAMESIKSKYNLPDKFILFLGTIEPRKNVIGVIKAFEGVKKIARDFSDLKDCHLVIVGPRGWKNRGIFKAIETSKFKNQIKYLGYIPIEEKSAFYSLADVFIYPSFYEGFGFPPLEAIKCETPVITSYNSSLAEVAGDYSILVNPYDIREIKQAILQIFQSAEIGKTLIKKGREINDKFNWQKTANEVLELTKKQ